MLSTIHKLAPKPAPAAPAAEEAIDLTVEQPGPASAVAAGVPEEESGSKDAAAAVAAHGAAAGKARVKSAAAKPNSAAAKPKPSAAKPKPSAAAAKNIISAFFPPAHKAHSEDQTVAATREASPAAAEQVLAKQVVMSEAGAEANGVPSAPAAPEDARGGGAKRASAVGAKPTDGQPKRAKNEFTAEMEEKLKVRAARGSARPGPGARTNEMQALLRSRPAQSRDELVSAFVDQTPGATKAKAKEQLAKLGAECTRSDTGTTAWYLQSEGLPEHCVQGKAAAKVRAQREDGPGRGR
jgi:hypothetical protein